MNASKAAINNTRLTGYQAKTEKQTTECNSRHLYYSLLTTS